jgi:CRP-like cAMP-binding protein
MIRPQAMKGGERTNPKGKPVANKILLAIPDAEYRRLRPHLEFIELKSGLTLQDPGHRLRFAYFLNRGLSSIVVASRKNRGVEAGVVGYEGVVGIALAVGLLMSPLHQVVQIGGDAFSVGARALQATLQKTPDFQMRLCRYAVIQGMQVAQTAACNRLHDVRQRLARWLLMAQDRVDAATLPLTHEFLAIMLGTDRPSVSLAAGELKNNNAIQYSRGKVEILNRKGLEALACECYRAIQQLNGELGLK